MKKSNKQKILFGTKGIGVCFILILIGLFIFRDVLLQKTIVNLTDKINQKYKSTLSLKKVKFDGLDGLEIQDIILVPKNADTLFRIETIKTQINVLQLLTGTIQLENLQAKNGFLQLVKNEKGRNFDAFLSQKKDSLSSDSKSNYAKLVYKLLNRALNLVPTDMQLENLSLRMDNMGKKATVTLKKLSLVNKQIESSLSIKSNTHSQMWSIKGFADPRNKQADIRLFNLDTGKIKVPYIDDRYHIKSSFDSIRINLSNIDMDSGELHVDGFASISNFTINHPKIASKDVVIKKARFDYNLLFGEHFVAIDSSSTIQLNNLKFNPFVSYDTEIDTLYTLKIAIPKTKTQDFITSLPEGLFTHFEGMQATGSFEYRLDFKFNKNKPNTLVFDSKLNKENLLIVKYGQANLNKLNGEFMYRAIVNGVAQRAVLVGSANPNYTPSNQISPYLKKSVLTTEDPSFFSHQGFITEAFKQSIVKNIKTKKFSRGGSTISMQLIKNAFLTREKTLSRKLEEILLVYILENNRIVSKERMLEVYFNIIEWGPNVYGIGEAAAFYFQKSPSELTLNECLYLANIIPSPRKFMYQFNGEGNLKSFAINRDKQLINIMMRRGILVPEDTIYQMPIEITGAARSFIKIKENTPVEVDSTSIKEFDF